MERVFRVKMASERVENELNQKHQKYRVLGKRDTEAEERMDSEYYHMVKAKMRLLEISDKN